MSKKYLLTTLFVTFFSFVSVVFVGKLSVDNFHRDSVRILNPREFSLDARASLLQYFMSNKFSNFKIADVVIIGDSQAYGFEYKPENTFSGLIKSALADSLVLNLSIQDARIKDNIFVLDVLAREKKRVKNLFLTVNEAHPQTPEFMRMGRGAKNNFWSFLLYPRSIFSALGKEKVMKHPMKYKDHWYKDCFADLENVRYFELLNDMLIKSKKVADNVVLYVTPHPRESVVYLGYSYLDLQRFFNKVNRVCKKHSIRCLYFDDSFSKDNFFDMVHFNKNGHEKMSKTLLNLIQ